jgi:F-type H+-transporting ATPase subunit a
MQFILAAADPLEHVLPHPVFGDHIPWFTNQSLMTVVIAAIMLIVLPSLFAKPYTDAPSGWKNAFEAMLEFMRNEVFRPALKERTDEYTPFLWTVFIFILLSNILGCLPTADFIELISGGTLKHIGGAPTSAFTTTAMLAIIAFFYIHFHGVGVMYHSLIDGTYGHHGHGEEPHGGHGHGEGHGDAHGHDHAHGKKMSAVEAAIMAVPLYFWNFAPHPFADKGPLFDVPMWFALLILEIIGAFIKPFALCMRLFGNMVSGHILLAVLISLIVAMPTILGQISVGIPVMALDLLIQLLEVLVAFLQAYIFVFLTALFIGGAVAPEH